MNPGDWPAVSVVMPVRNEVASVGEAVRSALSQEYPGSLEMVVADGLSDDGTRDVLRNLAATDARLRVVDNPSGTTPQALNAAIRASAGEIVVRCDAHASLPPGYIKRAVEIMRDTGADNVGGVQAASGTSLVQRAIALAMTHPIGVGNARFHLGGAPGPVDTVFLGVFRRAALDRVGLFDERLLRNQDAELNHRIRASGGVVYFHPELRVAYQPRDSLRALWRQYWSSGAWKRTTFRFQPGSFRPRQAAPPLLVLLLAGSAALGVTPWSRLAPVVPLVYLAGVLGAAIWLGISRREPAAALLPIVAPVMHLGWGLGFLVGRSAPASARVRERTS